jgi:hypothetical protein
MFDTMAACNGAGLAAPQIGVSVRVVVFIVLLWWWVVGDTSCVKFFAVGYS